MTIESKLIMQAAQLEGLLRHEEKPVYHRQDYMSDEWQEMLLKRQRRTRDMSSDTEPSPSSALMKAPQSPRSVAKITASFNSSSDCSSSRTNASSPPHSLCKSSCPTSASPPSSLSSSSSPSTTETKRTSSSLQPKTNTVTQERITPQWREKICTWNFHVVDY